MASVSLAASLGQMEYASPWRRLGAALVDGLVLLVICVPIYLVLSFGLSASLMTTVPPEAITIVITSIASFFVLAVSLAYSTILESSPRQATLGKQALGIYVSDERGGRLSFARALGRSFVKQITLSFCFLLGVIPFFSARRQAIHDKAVSAVVVRGRAGQPGVSGVGTQTSVIPASPPTSSLADEEVGEYWNPRRPRPPDRRRGPIERDLEPDEWTGPAGSGRAERAETPRPIPPFADVGRPEPRRPDRPVSDPPPRPTPPPPPPPAPPSRFSFDRAFASEDEEGQYCIDVLREGTDQEKRVARERLARIFERRGLLDEAAECYENNIRAGVRDRGQLERLAALYRRRGQHDLADEIAEQARALDANSA